MGSLPLVWWLIAGVCFIFSLGGLSRHETSRRGNFFGMIGMTLAIVAAFCVKIVGINGQFPGGQMGMASTVFLLIAIGCGATIGAILAKRVEMTQMPQLVAILHSFVGLAAVLVGIANFWRIETAGAEHLVNSPEMSPEQVEHLANSLLAMSNSAEHMVHLLEIVAGVFIGGVTFTGSVVAWGKLEGRISSTPMLLPNRHLLNVGLLTASLVLGLGIISLGWGWGLFFLILVMLISFVLGAHLVMAIGGADMPVVVSMLNSYSGWAAAAVGFMLPNDLLIVTGALVGSSGSILSYIMCHAMNRSFISVILGGFGGEAAAASSTADAGGPKTYHTTSADETADWLLNSDEVIVIPGYGMAVAQAQHPIREICELLQRRGVKTRFAIHPVAGRLPGHMNVLLAEANVPYDIVLEMEEINEDFPNTGTVLVIGANDIVNPGAQDDPSSPIYGMPVLECWKAQHVVILKRSMGTGYSGVDNPLFYKENSSMLFGDAKTSVDNILQALRSHSGV
ncbi:MAG: NAD(P)(+) transhydrogenase (Re/Si-specific) subunit beta [Pirellulaceae bacterium]